LIPDDLTSKRQWCTWHQTNGTKIPLQPNGFPIRSNDPSTFVTYDVARAASDKIAYVIQADDGMTGIDLDNCLDESGHLREWALPIVARLDGISFAEVSPSGCGIKFITRGKKTPGARCVHKFDGEKQQIEVYDFNRFWTITGNSYAGNDAIGEGQSVLDWICETYLRTEKPIVKNSLTLANFGSTNDLETRARTYVDNAEIPSTGDRNNSVFRIAGHLFAMVDDDGNRLSYYRVLELVQYFNSRSIEPLSPNEVEKAVSSAQRNGTPRADKRSQELVPCTNDVDLSRIVVKAKHAEEKPEPIIPKTIPMPRDLMRPPGTISNIIDYTMRTSLYPQPELALAGAIALMGAITGRKLTDNYGTRTNVYVLGLAPSGAGKEQARKTNKILLTYAGGESMIGNERIGSSAGMITAIETSPAILFQIDEIGRFLETLKNPAKAPHLYNVATVLMAIYGCSDSLWIGDAYADSKKTKKINQPHPVLYGTSVPEKFWESLTAENVTDGLLGRMMPFESAAGYVDPKEPENIQPNSSLIDQVRFWVDLKLGGNLYSEHPTPISATYTFEAQARFSAHMAEISERRKTEDSQAAALWSRSAGKAGKLALIFAASRCPISTTFNVELEDVDRAIAMGNWLTRTVQRKVFEHVSENETECQLKRVLRLLKQPLTKDQLVRKTQWLRRRDRNEIIETLVESGLVELAEEPTGGRPKIVLKAV